MRINGVKDCFDVIWVEKGIGGEAEDSKRWLTSKYEGKGLFIGATRETYPTCLATQKDDMRTYASIII